MVGFRWLLACGLEERRVVSKTDRHSGRMNGARHTVEGLLVWEGQPVAEEAEKSWDNQSVLPAAGAAGKGSLGQEARTRLRSTVCGHERRPGVGSMRLLVPQEAAAWVVAEESGIVFVSSQTSGVTGR